MTGVVLFADRRALIANVGAQGTDLRHGITSTSHGLRGQAAYRRTVQVGTYTINHFGDVRFT